MESPKEELPFQINDRLQVTIGGSGEEVATTYLSRVENMSGDIVTIGWPTNSGIRAPVREADMLSLFFINRGAVYTMDCRVVGRIPEPIPLLTVSSAGPVKKIQRRDYVRVPAIVDVYMTARVVRLNLDLENRSRAASIKTRTINISGAGLGIHHTSAPHVGDLYDIKLKIADMEEPIALTGKVVRCESVFDPVKGRYYDVGFKFFHIKESLRRQIVSYVFRFQLNSLLHP